MDILHLPFFNLQILNLNPIKIRSNFPSQNLVAHSLKILPQSILNPPRHIPRLTNTAYHLITLHPCKNHTWGSCNQYPYKRQIKQPLGLFFRATNHNNYDNQRNQKIQYNFGVSEIGGNGLEITFFVGLVLGLDYFVSPMDYLSVSTFRDMLLYLFGTVVRVEW